MAYAELTVIGEFLAFCVDSTVGNPYNERQKTDWSGFSVLTLVTGIVTFVAGWFVASKLGGE